MRCRLSEVIAPLIVEPDPGSGFITFGVAFDPETLAIPKPLTRFKRTYPQIAWGAHLTHGVTASSITWAVAKRSASGKETPVFSVDEPIDGSEVTILANAGDLALLVGNEAGDYVMRYSDASELLAEGTCRPLSMSHPPPHPRPSRPLRAGSSPSRDPTSSIAGRLPRGGHLAQAPYVARQWQVPVPESVNVLPAIGMNCQL